MAKRLCLFLSLSGALLAAAPGSAPALVPQEVLVVVNESAEGSAALGKYYCLSRNILEDRVVVLRTTATPIVGRKEYNENIRAPIREFLLKNGLKDKIKCLALMWGVPVRVLGTEPTPSQRKLTSAYQAMGKRLQLRLAVNAELLETVGLQFPQPRTKSLRPLGDLFAPEAGSRVSKAPEVHVLVARLKAGLKAKELAAAKIKDRARRQIALRQCAAIRLDVFGPKNLLARLPSGAVAGVPGKAQLTEEINSLAAEDAKLAQEAEAPELARQRCDVLIRLRGAVAAHNHCQARIRAIDTAEEDASVDSELALLWEDGARLRGPLPNPMNWRLASSMTRPANLPGRVVMTARVDGPTPRDALRIIKDSVEAEKSGVKGKFYIDAGGKYERYDVNLEKLAELVRKTTKIPVVLDKKKTLFARGSCPDAALYVGWYSLQRYIPAFTWVRGSVGWHVASLEAVHLRVPASDEWCVKMIQNGVAATIGAVSEPYLGAFPLPQDFFALLLTGRFTVAECYWRTVPAVSWRLTLVGDPLYNPYRLKPHLSIYVLPPKMVGRTPMGRKHDEGKR